ncbi:Uncharacterised protein [uncultured archaeon]|nr:Uncharacterised protein [uncultured archaeon]
MITMVYLSEDFILDKYGDLEKRLEEPSLCLNRNVYTIIITPDAKEYHGRNGCEHDPCTNKSPKSCTRKKGRLEYLGDCQSLCGEFSAMLKALGLNPDSINSKEVSNLKPYLITYMVDELFVKKRLEGSKVLTTGFPCPRCISLMIDAGISEVYFGSFKEPKPRDIDIKRAAELTSSGIHIFRISKYDDEQGRIKHKIKPFKVSSILESFFVGKARTSGEAYVRLFFDKEYQSVVRKGDDFLRENFDPFINIDSDYFVFPNKWHQ